MYELTQAMIADLLVLDKLPKFTSVGHDPLTYFTKVGYTLCADCALESLVANEFTGECSEDPATWVEPYYEGPAVECDDCGTHIESAYGDPDAEVES